MLIQISLHLNHCSLFSVAHATVLPVLKITTQAAESWLETHLASLSPRGGAHSRHHTRLSAGYIIVHCP